MNIVYPALISYDREQENYRVEFPDLFEAISQGKNMEEALNNATQVLTLTLEIRLDEGIEISLPSKIKNAFMIAPSARVQAALLIRQAKGSYTTSDIARALKTSWPAGARLENPHHWPTLRQLEKAAEALGHRLVLSLERTHCQG